HGLGQAVSRKIIHIDMAAFYASVEQRDSPELRGKPVAVGGSRERGVVAAASYEARKFGVHSAMPSLVAKRKCPELIFIALRFEVYKAISCQIRGIFAEDTPDHRADIARRGVSGCHRESEGYCLGNTDRGRATGKDPRQDRAHRLGWRFLQQVPRQDRLGS